MEEDNRSIVWVLVIGVILVVVAVFLLLQGNQVNKDPVSVNTDEDITLADDIVPNTVFPLTEQNDSNQNGTVVFIEVGDQVEVAITLTNYTDTPQPAHIHSGRCPVPGAVLYPLNDLINGSSSTLLDTSLEALSAKGQLALNIHKSDDESSIYVACGDLDF